MSAAVESSKQDYSAQYFNKELQSAEQVLAALHQTTAAGATTTTQQDPNATTTTLPLSARLGRLGSETEELLLLQAVTKWGQEHDQGVNDDINLLVQTDACIRLAQILQDVTNVTLCLFRTVYQREYLPLYEYLSTMLVRQLRQTLVQAGYPKTCVTTLWNKVQRQTADDIVGPLLHAWERLDAAHHATILRVQGSPPTATLQPLVVELVRPLVTRVHFHFVLTDNNRPTSTRLDRLAEWLFKYLRENFFQPKGPWEVIYYGWRPACAFDVLNEVARLVHFVLAERQLFRSNVPPKVLCRSIEEILQFDAFLQSWVERSSNTNVNNNQMVVSLTDSLVAGDDELLEWWLAVERESLFARLHHPVAKEDDNDGRPQNIVLMTPQAEVFGAMIRSIRTKAALFTSQAYLQQVAGPLCMQFLDAVHETATALKDGLLKLAAVRGALPLEAVQDNLQSWLALLNGTQWCALILKGELHGDEGDVMIEDDLVRFGQSLERLHHVLLTDLVDNLLGEALLLQKSKMANYLMLASHLLAGNLPGGGDPSLVPPDDLSNDLLATREILACVLDVCMAPDETTPAKYVYAHQVVREGILQWTASKFLESLLDESLVTEILAVGGRVVHKDAQLLFGGLVELPPTALRLLDVTHALQDTQLASIGDALCGLAGQPPPLTIDLFALDESLYDQAVSMVRAKGWLWLDLQDLLSVLNRRVDLSQPMGF